MSIFNPQTKNNFGSVGHMIDVRLPNKAFPVFSLLARSYQSIEFRVYCALQQKQEDKIVKSLLKRTASKILFCSFLSSLGHSLNVGKEKPKKFIDCNFTDCLVINVWFSDTKIGRIRV